MTDTIVTADRLQQFEVTIGVIVSAPSAEDALDVAEQSVGSDATVMTVQIADRSLLGAAKAREALAPSPQPVAEAVKPYAHEFGKSNGDGTYCVVIEKGPLDYAKRFAVPDWPITPLFTSPQPEGLGIEVKDLAWFKDLSFNLTATCAVGTYHIQRPSEASGDPIRLYFRQDPIGSFATIDTAKSAAQADFAARILSSLQPKE